MTIRQLLAATVRRGWAALGAACRGPARAGREAERGTLRLDPDFGLTLTARGIAQARRGNWPAAVRTFDEAVGLSPEDAVLLVFRGIARVRTGRAADAEADFDAAGRLDPVLGRSLRLHRTAADQLGVCPGSSDPGNPLGFPLAYTLVSWGW